MVIPAPELLLGFTEAFIVIASQLNFSLCSILSSFPRDDIPESFSHATLRVCFPGNLT
jgi:hypothetical protein